MTDPADSGWALLAAPDLAAALCRWRDWLATERRLSPRTVDAYTADLRQFLGFLAGHLGGAPRLGDLADLGIASFRAWLAWLAADEQTARSRARKLSSVKSLFTWLDRSGLAHNPAVGHLTAPRLPKRLPRPLDTPSIDRVTDRVQDLAVEDWIGARDRALLVLLYATGLRISEALSLQVGDLPDPGAEPVLRVTGKGGRQRLVPVLPAAQAAITTYLDRCPWPRDRGAPAVARAAGGPVALAASTTYRHRGPWPRERGAPLVRGAKGGRLTRGVAETAMRKARLGLGLPDTATPHALRHSFATHMLAAGAEIRSIQELLGHASLSSTQVYTDVTDEALIALHARTHPRN